MPFCPKCRSEYRAGFERCSACDVELVAEEDLPEQLSDEEIIAAMADEELVTVVEGQLAAVKPIQERLIDEGIPAALRKAEELMTEGGLFLRLELVVRQEDADRARVLVAALVQGEFTEEMIEGLAAIHGQEEGEEGEDDDEDAEAEQEGELACPACGSTEPLKDGECPECGLFLGGGE